MESTVVSNHDLSPASTRRSRNTSNKCELNRLFVIIKLYLKYKIEKLNAMHIMIESQTHNTYSVCFMQHQAHNSGGVNVVCRWNSTHASDHFGHVTEVEHVLAFVGGWEETAAYAFEDAGGEVGGVTCDV
jgi:hypothetical protein